MELSVSEFAFVRSRGLYVTQKCDQCGKLLNNPCATRSAACLRSYCSAACRELAFFANRLEAKKHSSPGKCVNCGAGLEGKRRGALYCDELCKKRVARRKEALPAARAQLSGTPTEPNEQLTNAEIGR